VIGVDGASEPLVAVVAAQVDLHVADVGPGAHPGEGEPVDLVVGGDLGSGAHDHQELDVAAVIVGVVAAETNADALGYR
jgi:hypothetical protein